MAWWVVVFVIMVCFERIIDWEILWIVCCGCFCDWFYDCLTRWFFVFVCYVLFLGVIDWMVAGIVCRDWLFRLVVFLLNGCDLVRKKKIIGLTVYCNAAVVKPYVKMSALWFNRLIFWFGRVLFVVKTLLCSGRRFASDTS